MMPLDYPYRFRRPWLLAVAVVPVMVAVAGGWWLATAAAEAPRVLAVAVGVVTLVAAVTLLTLAWLALPRRGGEPRLSITDGVLMLPVDGGSPRKIPLASVSHFTVHDGVLHRALRFTADEGTFVILNIRLENDRLFGRLRGAFERATTAEEAPART